MDSVQAIIAKARFNETYINMSSSTLGLSDNLDELASEAANLLDVEENGKDTWYMYTAYNLGLLGGFNCVLSPIGITGALTGDIVSGEGQLDFEDIDDEEIDRVSVI